MRSIISRIMYVSSVCCSSVSRLHMLDHQGRSHGSITKAIFQSRSTVSSSALSQFNLHEFKRFVFSPVLLIAALLHSVFSTNSNHENRFDYSIHSASLLTMNSSFRTRSSFSFTLFSIYRLPVVQSE